MRSLWVCIVAYLSMAWPQPVWAEETLLPVDKAFRVELHQEESNRVAIHLRIAPSHYIYQHSIRLLHNGQAIPIKLPVAQPKKDVRLGNILIYPVDITFYYQANHVFTDQDRIQVFWQGCSLQGMCYVPQSREFTITPRGFSHSEEIDKNSIFFSLSSLLKWINKAEDYFTLPFWQTILFFYFAGVMLAFTACMYPLIPIVSSLVIGQKTATSYRRAFALSLIYVQAMAIVYAGMGALAAWSGGLLSVYLQKPWVLLSFAIFFIVMAGATVGIFQIQLPHQWQSCLVQKTQHLPQGKYCSAILLGMVSALIVGPCVAPPLAAALAYIGKEGNFSLGMSALYMMAIGIGTPLLLIGVAGQHILPKFSSIVMRMVRYALGLILLLTAVWIAWPVLLGEHGILKSHENQDTQMSVTVPSHLQISTIAELNATLLAHKGQGIMLYVTADWCSACQEVDTHTFANDKVKMALKEWIFLTLDLSHHSKHHRDLLKACRLYGPPGVVFFDRQGQMLPTQVIGYQDANNFLQTLYVMKREIG